MKLEHIYIYPVKSLGGIEVNSAWVERRGLQHDRRFMLVDEDNKFLTQREHRKMALLKTSLSKEGIIVTATGELEEGEIVLPFTVENGEAKDVQVFSDVVKALSVSPEADHFFSERLGTKCRIVFMPEDSIRRVDPKYGVKNAITSFSDGYPFMILGTASLEGLNEKLAEPLGWDRFRPNFVISTSIPHEEDGWKNLNIGEIQFSTLKPCGRCMITTINQETAKAGSEPLRTLASYRQIENKILYGMYIAPLSLGEIKIGDECRIL